MASLRGHYDYLKYVIRHKRHVYAEGRKLGLGRWQLVIHDWHKFLPSEWFPYVEFFHGDWRKDIDQTSHHLAKDVAKRRFEIAWLKHQKRAPHHWQYWVLHEDDGDTKCLKMPDKYILEMVADWRGAGMALGKPDTVGWYESTRVGRMLNVESMAQAERLLGIHL